MMKNLWMMWKVRRLSVHTRINKSVKEMLRVEAN